MTPSPSTGSEVTKMGSTPRGGKPPREVWAHSANSRGEWHDLREHLQAVADRARAFAERFGAGPWGELAGLWHDLGKYSKAFQEYLRQASTDTHVGEILGKVDHSSAGAQHAVNSLDIPGHLLAYVIAGHHSGLLDGRGGGPSLESRLSKTIEPWAHAPPEVIARERPELPRFVAEAIGRRDGFSVAFFVRMLFSCLVDADFLDTERFLDPSRAAERPRYSEGTVSTMDVVLTSYLEKLRNEVPTTAVNRQRTQVLQDCVRAAGLEPGVFSLTVPTGGGKTLSSLAFALKHAIFHRLQRVVYVIPFTSVIEQNAEVFRTIFAPMVAQGFNDPVVEHHSAVDAGAESVASRLAAENWDAPLIVTTSVQFYESLFAAKASRCRKLHNLARSVIILDEAQALPVDVLAPSLRALRELVANYGVSIVLCTATQPAVQRRDGFPIGLEGIREIIPAPSVLYANLKRVEVADLGRVADEELVERIRQHEQVLCVVNTRGHARVLFERLGEEESHFHLSALMCPAHRSQVLGIIRARLYARQPCRLVATQLIEAGVDIDFPVVYRSLAGIDAIAQAAGRCNRNGSLPHPGTIFLFRPQQRMNERFLADTANAAEQVLLVHSDPLALGTVEAYFKLYYWDQIPRWDAHGVLDNFQLVNDRQFPFQFGFATVSDCFRLIQDNDRPVIVPWGEPGRALCEQLSRSGTGISARLLRQLQRYTVTVPIGWWRSQVGRAIMLVHEQYPMLASPEEHYSERLGLRLAGGQMPFLEI